MMDKRLVAIAVITALIGLSSSQDVPPLEWIPMSDNRVILPPGDDISEEVVTPIGFPFGGVIHHDIHVTTNGLISFGAPYTSFFNQQFPGFVSNLYLIAPFWDDAITINGQGTISYEIHTSGQVMQNVSEYVSNQIGDEFEGYWMMVVFWEEVPPYSFLFATTDVNTFQAILIMDSDQNSYAIFIYQCGLLEWDNSGTSTIGYNAGPGHFDNHDPHDIGVACVNIPESQFSNVFYQLHAAEPLPNVPAQNSYFDFLPHTTTAISSGNLLGCDDCISDQIFLPDDFPFGRYTHTFAYVGSNGHVSFRIDYTHFDAELFPTTNPNIYWDFVAAPFWSDIDLREEGSVSWEIHNLEQSQDLINSVSIFIRENYNGAEEFDGTWMMVVYWEDVHPWPHGSGVVSPFTLSSNTFQAIFITDGTKSYAVYTYRCGEMEWGDESTVGFNAGADYYENHPITGHFQSHYIACLQNISYGNLITNVIYDLVPDVDLVDPNTIPPYHNTIGSCEAAGITECCTDGDCRGLPLIGSCYCDALCSNEENCCYDQQHICPTGLLTDDYLILAEDTSILHMSLNGTDIETLYSDVNSRAYGIDYHLANGLMVWSDIVNNKIYKKNLNGTGLVSELVTTDISAVDDVAIDWIGNNLYWTDAVWARIEVMDLDSGYRTEVLRTGPNTNPRAIIVDPTTRYMYWTDLLEEGSKIERASMDGDQRQFLLGFLIQPNGLAIDIAEQRLYWCDTALNQIIYADLIESGVGGVTQLNSEIFQPFSLAVSGTSIYWTEWVTNTIEATHKQHGSNEMGHLFTVYSSPNGVTPRGISVVSSSQQPTDFPNVCDQSGCSHICMLSTNDDGFSCACPEGYELSGVTCNMVSTPEPTAPPVGSCSDAGYSTCCEHGSCGGKPATCFCDIECYERLDCCNDLLNICNEVGPVPVIDLSVETSITSATVSFVVPFLVHGPETYTVQYGLNSTLDQSSQSTTIDNADYTEISVIIDNLLPGTTYSFQLLASNDISVTLSGVLDAVTLEDAPSGPPQAFYLAANGTTLTLVWQPPLSEERNGIIISYTVSCSSENGDQYTVILNPILILQIQGLSPVTEYTCSIAASTSVGLGPYTDTLTVVTQDESEPIVLPWIPMGALFGNTEEFLPASDDGFEGPIEIATGFSFGTTIQTQVFVGTNGLISFGTGYNSFINQPFPGSATISNRYLVAPYWDDVDIRFDTGDISYEIHESGFVLDQVNAFIRKKRPTDFEGTWMMVAFYDAVHPYFGLFNSQENTFQVILITDGSYSYTIFTYLCGLIEWDNGVTIGFSAASEIYENHVPSSAAVACLNTPDSVWSNVIYRLSTNSTELPPPSNVMAVDITLNSTTIQWSVATIDEPQEYIVLYGPAASLNGSVNFTYVTEPISSGAFQFDQTFEIDLNDLTQGTSYDVQVVSMFGSFELTSDIITFTTLEPALQVAPTNFQAVVFGTSVLFSWVNPIVDEVIVSVYLNCGPDVNIEVKDINEVTLYDLPPETTLSCTVSASSSGGYGPSTPTINVTIGDALDSEAYFSFIPMDIHANFEEIFLPVTDDGVVGPIEVPGGLPFGDTVQTNIYIGTNGLISLGSPYNTFFNAPLPIANQVLIAPYWDDVDIRFGNGQISYEIHTSGYFLEEVSEFLRRRRAIISFNPTWMLIVYWDAVHPYFGLFNPEENTFQAIIITDGTYSYSIFTYDCGLMEWDNGVIIGISDGADFYDNFDPSSSAVACLNLPASNLSNVIYRLSEASPEVPPPDNVEVSDIMLNEVRISWSIPLFTEPEEYIVVYGLSASDLNLFSETVNSINNTNINNQPYSVTLQNLDSATLYFFRVVATFGTDGIYVRYSEVLSFITLYEPQTVYLPFLDHTNTYIDGGSLLSCENCSSFEITFPSDFPMGGYFHQSAYVNTNGYISFGRPLIQGPPEGFPPESVDAFWTYMVAPFWADFDTTMAGNVSWEVHNSDNSLALVRSVDAFIAVEGGDASFESSWMLVGFWENVQPSTVSNGNTFQAILTTNGTKSYSVFTYRCGSLGWSDSATIGFYAPATDAIIHPLSTFAVQGASIMTDEIACLHNGSQWSNVIYDLEDNNHILEMTPEPGFSTGGCVDAGFTGCCTTFCFVDGCYCDSICHFFQDCCHDIEETCPASESSSYDLLVGHGDHISQIHFEGTSSETVRTDTTGTVVGVDYLYSESLMFWSDVTTDSIHAAYLNGSDEIVLVDSCISVVDDIAVDWVSYKLYWVDSAWARIEALDLISFERVEILAIGTNTAPRAIAVDPINRVMFWTDYGVVGKIETASMNGDERRTLHFSEISQPNGITIDYTSERIYWTDAGLDRIEYSNYDGSNRNILEDEITGLLHPFGITVADNIVFWTDWETKQVYATHKEHGALDEEGFFVEIATFLDTPYGIEALRADHQPAAFNPCLNSECSHVCLLSYTNEQGFSCACPEGYEFENETFCKPEENPAPCSLTPGSCAAYSGCCEGGFCAGTPANCYCDADCRIREDCCSDINDTCIAGWPRLPRDITVTENTGTSVTISWLILYIVSTPETYTIHYGTDSEILIFQTATASGSDTTVVDQVYSRTIPGLEYVTTYFFRISVTNSIGAASTDVLSFVTAEGAPSAAPTDFNVNVSNTQVCLSWSPPPQDQWNGVLISYTMYCDIDAGILSRVLKAHVNSTCIDIRIANQEFTCEVAASTAVGIGPSTSSISVTTEGSDSGVLPFISLDATYGLDPVVLPEFDEGTFGPIALPDYGFPFWSSNRTNAYIAVNGLLSFDQPFDFFFNEQFPGFFSAGRYLVAPFWEDADTTGGRGVVSYEIHESGYLLDHVNAFLNARRPSPFQGTWMLVVFYDAVQPYAFSGNSGENSYQAILITDGTSTYTIFTYDCFLMEWGISVTIGFNAQDDPFMNNEYISYEIACSNMPDSNIVNVIYRLSENNPEYVLPQDIAVTDIQATTVTVQWTIPSVTEPQIYSVLYGTDPDMLDQTSSSVAGNEDITLINQQYSVGLSGLDKGTDYYFRISISFDDIYILTDLNQFRTLDDPPSSPPSDFVASVSGVAVNFTWAPPFESGTIVSYTLFCSVDGVEVFRALLKPVQIFTVEELYSATTYACGIFGTTSGGDGPTVIISLITDDIQGSGFNLPFVIMNTLLGTEEIFFPEADDGVNGPLSIPTGFPFGSSVQTNVFIGTNGILSFGTGYGSFFNQVFPGSSFISGRYLVAPFWDDADTRSDSGDVSYEVHESGFYLDQINLFLRRNRPSYFQGTWMMVIYWNAINPYFGPISFEENTFQAILVTDGTYSYTIFTYKCGLMEWDNGAIIGYNAAGESFANNDPSSSAVACLNIPRTDYSNVIYLLSNESPELPVPQDVLVTSITTNSAIVSWRIPSFYVQEEYYVAYGTDPDNLDQTTLPILSPEDTNLNDQTYSTALSGLQSGVVYYIQVFAVYNIEFVRFTDSVFIVREPEQSTYLQVLTPFSETTTLASCDDCTSGEIELPSDFPIGGYYHQTAYVSTNGLISFGREVTASNAELFPSSSNVVSQSYILAPFWADFDTTSDGSVLWWIDSIYVDFISEFIQEEYGDAAFSATWMLIATWSVQGNTFQAVLATDGLSKSYAIYTYTCGDLDWSDVAIIGYNTPSEFMNHPISGTPVVDQIACVHQISAINNLIFELETNAVILPMTPEPVTFLGSCAAAGFTDCCTNFSCLGSPADCYCDNICVFFNDCCPDFYEICLGTGGGAFDLLVGHGHHISQVHYEGTDTETIRTDTTGTVVGVDYFDSASKIFWSDVTTASIHRANMNGSEEEILVNTDLIAVDDIAVDWVSSKLYWADAGWARIEAMDMESLIRVELVRTGSNTIPRAIALDPIRRVMYWTDWGRTAKIETASMDGSERRDFVITDLSQPNGLSVDLDSERVYWSDSDLDKLEYMSFDGTGRTQLETEATGLLYPFSVSVGGDIVYWSDWETNSIYATHKEHGADDSIGYFATIASFPSTPFGVEALLSERQPTIYNPCVNNSCSHVCLLSEESVEGFTCGCPLGYYLDTPTLCRVTGNTVTPTPPPDGSCIAAGYEYCCGHGFCAGYPATCFCDDNCHVREDCCSDIDDVCTPGAPIAPVDIEVSDIDDNSARIRWTIPFITTIEENYYVLYGLIPDQLIQTAPITSGSVNVSITYYQELSGLDPEETYYFRVISINGVGSTGSDLYSFMTLSGPPSGPPLDFVVVIEDITAMIFSWSPPDPTQQNGVILSYTLSCRYTDLFMEKIISVTTNDTQYRIDLYLPGESFRCSVYATNPNGTGPPTDTLLAITRIAQVGYVAYMPFLQLGENKVDLLPSDDGAPEAGAIQLPDYGFPFWYTNRSTVYVGPNGLLSFDSLYSFNSNQMFPGFVSLLYLVAPFWDTSFGNGIISYEIYESGYVLDTVSAFIRQRNPSNFQGTWMMVAFWDSVRVYFSVFSTEENSYQAILITDGRESYTVFTYDCNLMEWGFSVTIGFNAAGGDVFENNPYTDLSIACSSLPESNITNVVYRLSDFSLEYPPPQIFDIDIGFIDVTLSWVVPYTLQYQRYSVVYGIYPDVLNQSSGIQISSLDLSAVNQTFTETLIGLSQGVTYYMRVSSTFGFSIIYSDIVSFTTLEPAPTGPPLNFTIDVTGTTLEFSWEQPAEELRSGLIRYYTLICSSGVTFYLNNVTMFSVDDYILDTEYTCTLSASTSGGEGPITTASATTESFVEHLFLPMIRLGSLSNGNDVVLNETDDGTSDPIGIPDFPFGDSTQNSTFVGTNGLLSFGTSYNSIFNSPFSEFSRDYLVAPFWDEVDIRGGNGIISYEIFESGYYLDRVNFFLKTVRPSSFVGTWMLVTYWDAVHPYFGATSTTENTFETILITDGTYSYAIFTYQCGLMEWDNGATIGFKASGNFYENNFPSSAEVACLNSPESQYSNVIYLLSEESPEIPAPDMVVIETILIESVTLSWRIPLFTTQEQYYVEYGTDPLNLDQKSASIISPTDTSLLNQMYSETISGLDSSTLYYLRVVAEFDVVSKRRSDIYSIWTKDYEQGYYLEILDLGNNAEVLEPCSDGCSSTEIVFPYNFPFGGYYHQTAYVNTNGVITFGDVIGDAEPELFPLSFWSYAVAPLWQNYNTALTGTVRWRIYDNVNNTGELASVNLLIQTEQNDESFNGIWMLVASWENVGYLLDDIFIIDTFQAILVTNGVKSYSIFTYKCDSPGLPGPVRTGYNAPPSTYYNHPLAFTDFDVDTLACSHLESDLNNVIIDLQPGNIILPITPQPARAGSCRNAGYDSCCVFGEDCIGTPVGSPPCYCDTLCTFFGDCCFDADHTCNAPTYDLLVGNGNHLSAVHFEGTVSETVQAASTGNVVGVDYHAARSLMFWSDTLMDTIHQADQNGENDIVLVDTDIQAVDDIAVDWIANNLYWVDSVWVRIEALNLDSMERAEIIRVGANSRPRAIAVDPLNRTMFWTDWGQTAKIERAFMDGSERRTLHDTGLSQPNGITIDYTSWKIYWTDSDLDKIEYSNYDGSERTILETVQDGLLHPFGLTIADELLFWTDWETNYLYYTHKDHGNNEGLGVFQSLAHFTSTPYGVEAIVDSRQVPGENPCAESECEHICLLSATSDTGYVCGCVAGADLQNDDKSCSTQPPPEEGSCIEADYENCCSHGFCAGYPATCSCNPDCHDLGDCCSDIDDTCPASVPNLPTLIQVTDLTHIRARIEWTVPLIVFTPELYTFMYSTTQDDLNTIILDPMFSGTDIAITDQLYFVLLEGLSTGTTYYYQIKIENTVGMVLTDVASFNTPSVGPPQNFVITVEGTETLTFSWDLPFDITLDEIDYFIISCEPTFQHAILEIVIDEFSVTLEEFLPGTTYNCTVAAKTDELGAPAEQTATTAEAPDILPFLVIGITEGVEMMTLPPSDDATSDPIYITGGLPVGSTTHTIAYVGTNGIISLGQPWTFWNPDLFPTDDYYIHISYVYAPFWADIDTRLAGSVYYETHQRGINDATNAVLERVSGFIASKMGISFSALWMIVAQWDRVHPFPHGSTVSAVSDQYSLFLNSENTFQAIVITDGMQNFVIYTYQCGLIQWSGEGSGSYATIGYNLNGVYENHPLSGTIGVNNIAGCLNGPVRRQTNSNWFNQIYQLPTAVDPLQELRAQCMMMGLLDIESIGDIQDLSSSLGTCPPSVSQAFLDFRFTYNSDVSTTSSRCYVYVFPAGVTALSSLICCYAVQSSSFGALLVGGAEGSSIALYHPNHYYNEHQMFDKDFRDKCCASGLCDVFHNRRPIDPLLGYIPPFFGFGTGDPHIATLDNRTYTFNGRGEYTLVENVMTGFALQGRTEPVSETSNATQFSAFAMGIKAEELSAEIRLFRGRLVSFINGEEVSNETEAINASTSGESNAIFITRLGENTVSMLLYRNLLAYVFTVTQRGDILDLTVNLEQSLMGQTRGLFGNFNGDPNDDFIMPNGISVPSDASDQMLHDYGQSWQIVEEESLFTYPVGTTFSDYTFPDHIPPLISDVVASAPVSTVEMCNNNEQCIFDAVQTGDLSIGTGTLNSIDTNNNDVMIANNFPPSLNGEITFRINVGVASVYVFTASDEDIDNVQITVEGPPVDAFSLIPNGNSYTLTITVDEVIDYSIMIVAVDSMNAVSTLSPRVEVCNCQNGGNCTLDGILDTDDNVIVMLCQCTPGWEGIYCEDDQDGCASLTCFSGVQCYDVPAPEAGAVCGACPDGYQGDGEKCADVDECNSTDISSTCGQMSICINTPGSFMCSCLEGYELSGSVGCTDTNECLSGIDLCDHDCSNTDGSYTCSCRAGYELVNDGFTCNVSEPCETGSVTCDENGECVVINGAPTCSCNSGFRLGNDGSTCTDINECQNELICEESCVDTVGTYTCTCGDGYMLSSNQRDCEDIDECFESDTPRCETTQVCKNTDGSYECVCPAGTELSNGECKVIEITKPPTVVIPPTEKPSEDGRANSVNVTLIYSKEEFDVAAQFNFKIDVAYQVTKYCISNTRDCGVDPTELEITFHDVIILDEIVNDTNGRANFLVYVYSKNPTDVFSGKILEIVIPSVDGVYGVAAVIGEPGSLDGISGGAVAAIVIVLILVLVAVLIVAAFLLYRYRKSVPKMTMISNLSMCDVFRTRGPRSTMLIEEDIESMKDTTSVSGELAEAKAKEAAEETQETPAADDETKVDLSAVGEAEQTL